MKILFVTAVYPTKEKPYYCVYLEQQAQALQALENTVEILFLNRSDVPEYVQNGLLVRTLELENAWLEKFWTKRDTCKHLRDFAWERYDVVSLHLGRVSYFNTIADICRERGVAVLQHFHGLNIWKEYSTAPTIAHWMYNEYLAIRKGHLISKSDAVIGVSNLVCAEIRKKSKKREIYTVYNGVNLDVFYPDQEKKNTEQFQLICVANLIPLKGQQYLLEAVSLLKGSRNLRLILIGEGSQRDLLESRCRELKIEDQVVFLGAQSYQDVARHMRNSDMFIMPSCYEAFGCVFVEAMGSGVLTCGCEDTGAEEIITHGVNGLLLKQRNTKSIADAICYAMEHREQAQEIAACGRIRAKDFSWERSARMLQNVYQEIVTKKQARKNYGA